jgi:hypothetical protein
MNVLIFKPAYFIVTLILNLIYLRAVMSFYLANQTHKKCGKLKSDVLENLK